MSGPDHEHEVLLLLGLGSITEGRRIEAVAPGLLANDPAGIVDIGSPLGRILSNLYEGAESWAPRLIGKPKKWLSLQFDDDRVRSYRIRGVDTWLVGMRYAGVVAGVRVRFDGENDDCVSLMSDLLFARPRVNLVAGNGSAGMSLIEALAGSQRDVSELVERAAQTRDVHLVFTSQTLRVLGRARLRQAAFDPRERQLGVDLRALRNLLYKGTSRDYRSRFSPIVLPDIGNGQPWKLVALFAETSVLAGWSDPAHEGPNAAEAGQMHIASLLGLAASVQSRQVRADAYATLSKFYEQKDRPVNFADVQARRRSLGDLSAQLRALQIRQHLGVVTYLDLHMARPTVAAAEYYKALVRAIRLDVNADITSGVIQQLAQAIDAESAAVSSEEQARLNSTTEAVRGASLTGGAVALLLASVGLFAALAAAPRPREPNVLLLKGWPAAAGAAGLTVVLAALLGLLLALLTRWASSSPRGRRRIRFYAKCSSAVLWIGSVFPLVATVWLNSATTLATAVLMIILGLVLYVGSEPGWLEEP